ncbi:MAG: hypothetical protein ACRDQZ_17385, partial [Mycobacteriales bacterium]
DMVGPALYSAKQSVAFGGWLRFAGRRTAFLSKVAAGTGLLDVDLAPWSGLLVPAELASVSPEETPYFFGWDDYEFCMRAMRHGWDVYGVADAVIGSSRRSVPGAPWKRYYFARNAIIFYRRNLRSHRVRGICWLARHLAIQLVRSVTSVAMTRMWLAGVTDGLRGRGGMTVVPHAADTANALRAPPAGPDPGVLVTSDD